MNRNQRPFILLGAGGHAKVVLDILKDHNFEILGVCDPLLESYRDKAWRGIKVLGGDSFLRTMDPSQVVLANGIGITSRENLRKKIYCEFSGVGFAFPPLIHGASWVSSTATIESGAQIMAGAIIQADVLIGENSIINTGATIDHDSEIGAHTHIAPGVTICGNVSVGESSFIGSKSVILEGSLINASSFIRANSMFHSLRK